MVKGRLVVLKADQRPVLGLLLGSWSSHSFNCYKVQRRLYLLLDQNIICCLVGGVLLTDIKSLKEAVATRYGYVLIFAHIIYQYCIACLLVYDFKW